MSTMVTVLGKTPEVGADTFVAPSSILIGDLKIGSRCSIWFNVVIRADVCSIEIGDESNIQDGSIIHGTYKRCGVKIGRRVTVGHKVMLHGCEIGDGTLIGMDTTIMDLSQIGRRCLVGAGSLVTEKSKFEDETLIFGRPAKAIRKLTTEELKRLEDSADHYLMYKGWYQHLGEKWNLL